ncbi:MAG: S-layer homology domain-containing protein [Oscillospiraceae bacterium]|nr:S-layer homology domain-containing protein [Oscillospiraceae bacterium]
MKRILCSALLLLSLLVSLIQPVFATRSGSDYSVSDEGRAFISEMCGGSVSDSTLTSAEAAVNDFIDRYNADFDQQKFEAMVDLVVNYGAYILDSGYKCETVIGSGDYTDVDVANALCSWVKKDGELSQERLNRRIRETKLFLYGSYDGVCEANFRYVIFNPNGGSLDDNTVLCYPLGGTYSNLPTASRSGWYFAGWYTEAEGGTHLVNSDTVSGNKTVYAHWSDTKIDEPNEGSSSGGSEDWPPLPELKCSEPLIAFIKEQEGFVANPYYDYGQYTVGYGTRYDPDNAPIPISAPITEAEADYLLRYELASVEVTVDKQFAKGTVEHTQAQYDAIVSFTFNLGWQWINSSYKIYQYILFGGYTEMEFVNVMGRWCNAGGTVLTGLARRRMDEANMYLNGGYERFSNTYYFLQFNGSKGEPAEKYHYYKTGEALGFLPTATREGYYLLGWFTKNSGGEQFTVDTVAPSNGLGTVYAQWAEGQDPNLPPEETDPPEETNPPETEPPETDPPETEPPIVEDPPMEGFVDVSGNAWYYEPVMLAVEAGLFSGVSETEFMPDGTMSRAMLATVLYRMSGESGDFSHPFTDVPDDMWYSDAIAWAYEKGIVNGISESTFGVNDNVSRQQLMVMLLRFANYKGYTADQSGDLSAFSDVDQIAEYAQAAVTWAVGAGIVNGSDGMLLPNGSATRAQCAKMLMCFLNLYTQG